MTQKFEQFGKYLLLEKLATGGMAEVFLARSNAASGIAKFVAIKRILPQYADSPEFIEMFKDEAKIAVNLSHGNIVSIYDFGVQSGQFYLVMDFVSGRNLRQILNKIKKTNQKLGFDQIVYMVKEIASGLDHAHRCLDGSTGKPLNITHRDMSPQNVMVSFEGEVKIVDFGIAKAESQLETTRAGTLKGKFGYMSPEQAEGQPVDLRTDIFSLGIVLWELLANDRLFIANNEINTLRKIRDCQVPSLRKLNPNIPSELERITMKALARDRNLRYQTAAAMHRDLNRFLNRQYPEFSAQDFASVIGNLFSEEIFSMRQKLVEYSKIPAGQVSLSTPSSGDRSGPATLSANTNSFVNPDSSGEILQRPSGLDSSNSQSNVLTGSNSSANFDFNPNSNPQAASFPDESPIMSPLAPASAASEAPTQLVASPAAKGPALDQNAIKRESIRAQIEPTPYQKKRELSEASQPSISQYSRSSSRSGIHRQSTGSKSSWLGGSFVTITVVSAFLCSVYVFLARYYPKDMAGTVATMDPYLRPVHAYFGIHSEKIEVANEPSQGLGINPAVSLSPQADPLNPGPGQTLTQEPGPIVEAPLLPNSQGEEPAPLRKDEARDSILVSSAPSGAEIYVNGVSTGANTPSRVEVPAHRTFNLVLKRTGFLDYTVKGLAKSTVGSRINATLQPALVGYIDIDVMPPQNARIYVNNIELKEQHLPITNYAVPAETEIVIRAEDPVLKKYSQRTVRVSKGRRQSIYLDLRQPKTPRLPSNNR